MKVSARTRNASCKVFLGKTIRHHLRIHYTTRKPFFRILSVSCFSQNTIQNMKNIQLFSRCLRARPACAHSSLQALREFVMSRCHTRGYSWCKIKVVFFNFSLIFACFVRFPRFGGFVSAVSVVSLVSVVSVVSFRSFRSFRWFRFGGFVSAVSFRCFGF